MGRSLHFKVLPRIGRVLAGVAVSMCLALGQAVAQTPVKNPPPTLDSRDLKAGMKGHGLTVVRGTKIDRFDIEVIGVLHHALPRQDIILVRCAGLNIEHSGIVAGMSGSPIFVHDPAKGDLLIGALSYGFGFNKDPVAGVTPIADMLPEFDRKLLPPPVNQKFSAPKKGASAFGPSIRTPDGTEMRPVGIPLVASGFHPDAFAALKHELGEMGFDHVHLATSGAAPAARDRGARKASPAYEPGSAISLALARGDMSISGIGTITWVRGDQFIAFGHPFKGLGQVHLPVGNADIQWILSSVASSFKMGNALDDIGILDLDRQPAVAGRVGIHAQMVPFTVTVRHKELKTTDVWHVEATDQPGFFPLVASMIVGNAARVAAPVAESVGVDLKLALHVDGRGVVETRDVFSGLSGMQGVGEIGAVVGNYAKAITFNGFERLRVGAVTAEIVVSESRNLAFLEFVRSAAEEVEAGQPIPIKVGLMIPNVEPPLHTLTLTLPALPAYLAGSQVTVQIGSEKAMGPEFPEPAHVEDLLKFLRAQPSRSRLAAVVAMPEPTLMLRGSRLTGLPMGVRDELQGHQVMVRTGKDTLRTAQDTPWVINGSASLKLRVKP
ncbi:MAG: hypothetical protein FJ100_03230 [Deltaproteobacteria bacterium]|nr:hypothetical protein [Deltaproteobacteria bacterium]